LALAAVGTYELGPVKQIMYDALDMGLYHFDTAAFYENEEDIGHALREKKVPRDSVFVTSKLWYARLLMNIPLHLFESIHHGEQ
jgi:diketogulonate reductase-like aldo/keto reductase